MFSSGRVFVRASRALCGALVMLSALSACAQATPLSPTSTVTLQAAAVTVTPERDMASEQPSAVQAAPDASDTPTAMELPATCTPTPTLTPTSPPASPPSATAPRVGPSVAIREGSITFAAYPYPRFQQPQRDPIRNFLFLALDFGAYQDAASREGTTPRVVRSVILENEYLRLTFLPELGGRLFQITYKPANVNLLYNDKVLKPTHWGPAGQGGWLAVGGMEWALPVNEHGYEWGTPWQSTLSQDAAGATLTLTDSTASDRVRARVAVTLPAHAAYVVVHPRIENPTAASVPVQFWINAQLALGAPRVSPNTDFLLATDSVWVHSTGNDFIPGANVPGDKAASPAAPVGWPLVGGVDLAHYSNWRDYLGVFATASRPYAGAYNHDTGAGLARVFPPEAAPGVKLFAFGPGFCCRNEFADDGSDYFELWGGLPRTFFASDDVTLAPGAAREWTEYWLPVAGTGGLSAATREGALYLSASGGSAQIGAQTPARRSGVLVLLADGREIGRWTAALGPGAPFTTTAPAPGGHLQLRLLDAGGNVLVETE